MPLPSRRAFFVLALTAQVACVNANIEGKIDGAVFNVRSLALRAVPDSLPVDNPNGVSPTLTVHEYVAVLSDQDDVCADQQAHILRKKAKLLYLALGQLDASGLSLAPAEDKTYEMLDLANLAFSSDTLPLPIKTLTDGYAEGEFFVLDEDCNAPLLQEHASSGGTITVARYDGSGLLADFDLRLGTADAKVSGNFLAPICPVDVARRPPASCH